MSSTSFGSTVLLDAGYIFFFVIWFISIVFLIIFLFYNSTHIVMQLVTICWSTTHSTSNAQTALFPVCASEGLNVAVKVFSFCSEIYGYGHCVCVRRMLPGEDGTLKCIAECFV